MWNIKLIFLSDMNFLLVFRSRLRPVNCLDLRHLSLTTRGFNLMRDKKDQRRKLEVTAVIDCAKPSIPALLDQSSNFMLFS